ncbi:hypothetical protein TREMEDRAFT_25665 [Tremella mesenterica DSM 1558]|uniref:uncharacterized protein n=1 Tax=Tremella mesenterica (strain ATCC 24925 / CBS 8224 / DSM 1558 / NBRC 9311 / NRRL Y-6157 / RJB 2259-6 / UBC 559-6) TaxID=578456 RepID=UPI0003F49301|nr:uncharacterized protein TREMEDRAFT_25665 [Tremella mesenterica DSM 1558]EIW73571.1 hypothetical protein TREMEDRAFT_25665 [Tremella mesenterica DSM 1558]
MSNHSSRLPTRRNSFQPSLDSPPADAVKPDFQAIDDVYNQVASTGSLEAAARKLRRFASAQRKQPSLPSRERMVELDPEEEELRRYRAAAGKTPAKPAAQIVGQEQDIEQDEGLVHMNEIIKGLWIGDLVGAMDIPGLEKRGITNILSLLRPSLQFEPQFAHYPVEIDDSPDTDILTHLPSCVAWIEEALSHSSPPKSDIHHDDSINSQSDPSKLSPPKNKHIPAYPPSAGRTKPGGVLVHCQAGVSRSATVVAAYLVQTLGVDPVEAVELIRQRRPQVDPSDTFWHQLGLFYNASGRVSLKDKSTRRWYMERTTSQFMNGDGSPPMLSNIARFPITPTASNPPTPHGVIGRRKIRCKMCRRHLAVREHMMDHIFDQNPQSRPRTPSNGILHLDHITNSFDSIGTLSDVINPLTGKSENHSRRASASSIPNISSNSSISEEMEISGDKPLKSAPISPHIPMPRASTNPTVPTLSTFTPINNPQNISDPVINERKEEEQGSIMIPKSIGRKSSKGYQNSDQLASRLPPALLALRTGGIPMSESALSSPLSSPDKDNQSQFVQVKRRLSSTLAMTPTETGHTIGRRGSHPHTGGSNVGEGIGITGGMESPIGYPILVNPKCSGYFVEPLTWMEVFLKDGEVSGRIICPNEACKAKIGSYDWAGMQCGCKEWVTPGFCIHRSKVDEVW